MGCRGKVFSPVELEECDAAVKEMQVLLQGLKAREAPIVKIFSERTSETGQVNQPTGQLNASVAAAEAKQSPRRVNTLQEEVSLQCKPPCTYGAKLTSTALKPLKSTTAHSVFTSFAFGGLPVVNYARVLATYLDSG